jgi:hypothetical protein
MLLLLLGWARDAVDLQAVSLCSLRVVVAALRCNVPEDRLITCIIGQRGALAHFQGWLIKRQSV